MPFPGPWIDPGPTWGNAVGIGSPTVNGQIDQGPIGSASGAADAAAPVLTAAWPASVFDLAADATAIGSPAAYQFQQATLRFSFDESNLIYIPNLPPGAIGYELEPPADGVFLGANSTMTVDITSTQAGPGTDMASTNWWFFDGDGWHRQSALMLMPTRTTATFTATTATGTLAPGDFTLTALGGGLTRRSYSLLAVADRQVTGAMLAAPGVSQQDDATLHISGVTLSVYFNGPRYRFIYDFRPPLAHRQRQDGVASAGPPLAHIGTAGSRPPLAWRQNNP